MTSKKTARGPLAGPLQSEPNLFGVDEKGEGVGDDGRARMGIVRGGGRRRAEVRGDEIDVVVGVVEGHGASATLRVDFFYERKLGGRVFVGDGEGAVAARGEGILGQRIKAIGVDTLADGYGANDFAGVAVDKGHEIVMAADDEDFVSRVDRET